MKKQFWILCAALTLSIQCIFAQNTLTAIEVLRKAAERAGGEDWQNPKTLRLNGTAEFTPYGLTDKTHRLFFETYTMHRIFPQENQEAHKANGKVRFDAAYGDSAFFRLKFDGVKSDMYLSERAKPYAKHFNWSNNFGFGIIRFADAPGYETLLLTDDQVEGKPCYLIRITDPKKNITVFGIDKKDFYIRMVAFSTDVGFHHRIYSDFKKAKNVNFLQPTRVRLYFDGIKWMDILWKEFEVNQEIKEEVFEVKSR